MTHRQWFKRHGFKPEADGNEWFRDGITVRRNEGTWTAYDSLCWGDGCTPEAAVLALRAAHSRIAVELQRSANDHLVGAAIVEKVLQ